MEEIETEIEGNKDESETVRIYRVIFFDKDYTGGGTTYILDLILVRW